MEDIPEGNPIHNYDPTQPPAPAPPGNPAQPPAAPPGYGGGSGGFAGGSSGGGGMPRKPGKLTTIAIIMLVSGIFNLMFALGMLLAALGTMCLTLVLFPLFLTAGILEIIHASKLLKDPIEVYKPAPGIAVLEICCILGCNWYALVAGILNLVFWGDPEVKQYYRDVAIARGYQPQV